MRKLKKKTKSFSHFIWLILLIIVSAFVTFFNESSIKSQTEDLKKTLNNIYFQKVITKIGQQRKEKSLYLKKPSLTKKMK